MELQFACKPFQYLQRTVCDIRSVEETLELRLQERLDGEGKIIRVTGEPFISGKEWRTDRISVEGGVKVWLLYSGENNEILSAEAWIPFWQEWMLRDSETDGKIIVSCSLKSIDARIAGTGKVIIRVCVDVQCEALEQRTEQLYDPPEERNDILYLEESYPLLYPAEADEKTLMFDEETSSGGGSIAFKRILNCSIYPELQEKKIMADKLVWRGALGARVLCQTEDGKYQAHDFRFPVSQYIQLEKEYGEEAVAQLLPIVNEMDMSVTEDGKLCIKGSLTVQFVLYDREMIRVVKDAYSNQRAVKTIAETSKIPTVLDRINLEEYVSVKFPVEQRMVLDQTLRFSQPVRESSENGYSIRWAGTAEVLYCDEHDVLKSVSEPWEYRLEIAADKKADPAAYGQPFLDMHPESQGGQVDLKIGLPISVVTMGGEGFAFVYGLEVGDATEPDPNRPSLILCRSDGRSLWELAKRFCSTVEQICSANGITEEPDSERMLLIPVV